MDLDEMHPKILKELAVEPDLVFTHLSQHSLKHGKHPKGTVFGNYLSIA